MNGVAFDEGSLRWLNLLWVVLLVVSVGIYGIVQRRRALAIFSSANLLARIAPRAGWTRPLVRLTLVSAALLLLVAAIIGPRWGQAQRKFIHRGIDVMVLLDVSRSMLARDIAPNRLERAKLSIRDDLLPALGGDRVGIITFAGLASVKCPLTHDYGFTRLVLEDISTNSSAKGGTLIGDAIRKAKDAFDDKLDTHKVLLLITDGEDQDSYPLEAAQNLWTDLKIPIVTVALGDEREGARIPVRTQRGEEYVTHDGKVVWSKANFDTLRAIAKVSSLNAFVPVGTRNFDLGKIYRDRIVPAIEFKEREESRKVTLPSQYWPFALGALLLLLIDSFLRDGPRPKEALVPIETDKREAA